MCKLPSINAKVGRGKFLAFTLVENVMTVALVSLIGLSFSNMIILSGRLTGAARENLTAAAIIESKIEVIRTSTWDQINSNYFIPTSFSLTNNIPYYGTISLSKPPGGESYKDDLRQLAIVVKWGPNSAKTLQMVTYISRYGLSANP